MRAQIRSLKGYQALSHLVADFVGSFPKAGLRCPLTRGFFVAQSRRNLKLKGDEKSHLERSD
jgi:hypothetical protein